MAGRRRGQRTILEKLRSYEEQMTEKYKDLSDDPMSMQLEIGNHFSWTNQSQNL